ncbi:MAG: CBS domain-containing protein [Chloroflexi bacterium]|nr:CBS domain-containing protein [Chloroflexota bacterium]
MLLNDYSQLPVISGKSTVRGMISWQSIGQSLSQGVKPDRVQDCMTRSYREVRADSRLLDVVEEIVDNGSVLVVGSDSQLLGIITTADLSEEFKKLAEPFLQIGEIEQHLRNLLSHLDGDELQKFTDPSDEKSVGEISDLALGEIIRILQNKEVWETVAVNLDRKVLVNRLEEVREIRNQVMHFDPDGLDESQLELIRGVSKMLHELRELPRRQSGRVTTR